MHIPRGCIVAALKAGRIAEACDKLTASGHLDPTVGTLLNVGDCRARLGQTATAWAAFVEAGRVAKRAGDARRAEAERRASELEPKLSYLTIVAAAPLAGETVTRGGAPVDSALFGEAVPLDPGSYEIVASAPGRRGWSRTVTLRAGGERQTVEVPELAVVRVPAPAVVAARVTPAATPSTFTTQREVAVVTAGAGVVALGASAVLALQAKSLEGDARAACPGKICSDPAAAKKSDDAVAKANLATYVGIAGAAALAGGAVLWLTGAPEPRLAPSMTRESIGVSWGGHF